MLYHGNAMDYIYETPDILQYILENKKEILEDSNRAVSYTHLTLPTIA